MCTSIATVVGVALAALVVAIFAGLIALISALYTRTQALAAKGSLAIERERYNVEAAPRFDPVMEYGSEGLVMRLTYKSEKPMNAIRAEIRSGHGVEFDATRKQEPAGRIESETVAFWTEPLFQDSTASWGMEVDRNPGQVSDYITLKVYALEDKPLKRTVQFRVKVPPRPDMSQAERAALG